MSIRKLPGLAALVLLLAPAGCPRPARPPDPPPSVPELATDAPVEPDVAEPDAACMETCLRENQMRAVGAEVIEADCRRECAAATEE